ncbi:leaf rust 10 disease-resistance locus receptor-like protein kinase-like 2.4 protein [Tanacetum coccineum]|uniref:Leaf rust 10 disease-resistance locus receptor-like protein kinase-like 2.4 protein n=1 Tax=Tanacetum coccineum TaxID=301880 RepID=A0ABQ5AE44_9ASTR
MNASLLFGCPVSFNVLGIGSIFCSNNGVGPIFLVPGIQGPGICNTSVIVPFPIGFTNTSGFINTTGSDQILQEGFGVRWKVNGKDCTDCMRSGGQCMYDNVTRLTICSSPSGFSCGIAGIILLLFVIICQIKRLRGAQKTANHQIEKFIRDNGNMAPRRYKYLEIKKMTNSFLEKLGQGGYGSVYKGQLPNGKLVAVKLLDDATGDGEDFINEVASISKTSHVNIVTLLGFCIEGKKRALMYEFMPNGSLDKFLQADGSRLHWDTLFLIAKGIARGLEYLHRGCNTRIVHFDIKPHNILLDEEFVPKISDFGLAKLCRKKESIVSEMGVRGTAGYMAPEVFLTGLGGPSHKSDVYSYGMMVLEMTGARKNNNANLTSTDETYFPDLIHKRVETGDKLGVDGVTTEEEDELTRKMVTVGLWCIQSDPSDRPSISKVIEMLEGSFKSLQVPPRHFCWSYLPMPGQGTTTLTTQSSEGLAASQNFSS